jgi:hypothetical protein
MEVGLLFLETGTSYQVSESAFLIVAASSGFAL